MSILWLIPAAVLAIAAVVLLRGAAGAAHEVRALRASTAEIDAALADLSGAVAQARATFALDGRRPGSAGSIPELH